MKNIVLKLLCWWCVAATSKSAAYQNANVNAKTAYIETQLRHKFNTKDIKNRYATLLMGVSSTTEKPSWPNSKSTTQSSYSSYRYSDEDSAVRLRHSRFQNLDGILKKLDKLKTTTKPPPTTKTSLYHYRFGKPKTTTKNLYENYDESDDLLDYEDEEVEEEDSSEKDNDNLPDYDNWDADDDNTNMDDLDDDENLMDEDDDGWQAEEGTEPVKPSSLTQYKWEHYGTRSRVEESRRKMNYPEHSSNYAEVNAATQHALRMNKEGRCRTPLPRVLSIQNEHPDPGKSYMPHCTVLHRCADDTGCCPNHSTSCAPKRQNLIYLYFYTTTIGKPGSKVEKLPFYNHTECACLDKSSEPATFDTSTSDPIQEVQRSSRSNLSVRAADSSFYFSPESIRRCKCPTEYIPRAQRGTSCTCDCAEGNLDCTLIKRGNEFFSLKDRVCILNGQCGYPSCEYGAYKREVGRCPRKQEKIDDFASISTETN